MAGLSFVLWGTAEKTKNMGVMTHLKELEIALIRNPVRQPHKHFHKSVFFSLQTTKPFTVTESKSVGGCIEFANICCPSSHLIHHSRLEGE